MHTRIQKFYWRFFKFGFNNFVNLSTVFFIKRFYRFFMIFIKSRLHSRGQRFLHPLWHDLVVIRISKFFFKKGLSSSLTSCASRLEFQSRRPVQEAGVREKTP